jgi:hypothetical protein
MADTTVDASDRRIARVERVLDLGALGLGVAVLLLAPGARVTLYGPSLVVAAGIALLGAGLLRDLAWLALQGNASGPRSAQPSASRSAQGSGRAAGAFRFEPRLRRGLRGGPSQHALLVLRHP